MSLEWFGSLSGAIKMIAYVSQCSDMTRMLWGGGGLHLWKHCLFFSSFKNL